MVNISATILAYNEEKRMGACLESLRGVADEIIVVDSYSTDRTVDICRKYGCRITQRKFDGFGAQRQYATSLTSHQYVLSIDADEVLSPALQQSIRRLKDEGFGHRVYNVSRLNFYCGIPVRRCGWYPDLQIRLFDKRYANWNLRDVAEKVIFRDSVRPELLDGDILHYRCDTKEQYEDVIRHHAAIKARVLASGNDSIGILSPFLHGIKAFWHTYITEGGILEGDVGREIAFSQYRSELLAYSAAKSLLNKK
ncbi:MAG: glycosyltransferase family 2 protein [Duncaniella sp.]|nr:glycosyltransferase family 2 protein [Duncaniella sp.]